MFQDLSKLSVPAGFRGRSLAVVQLWWCVEALLFRPSPQIFYRWRTMLLRIFGAQIGVGVKIRPSASVTYPWKLSIGDFCHIGEDVTLYTLGRIDIGSNTVISQGSYICAAGHRYDDVNFPLYAEPIVIEPEVWLAAECFVMPGVTVGKGAVCNVRSLVTKDIPAGSIAMGHPAKVVTWRERCG